MRQEVLCMERVSCSTQGVMQLEDFNLRIFSGEIMGLLPINNHGLTALLKLLQHNTPLRYGYVSYRGEQVNTWRTANHRGNRIGLIQSESCLVEGLTVADNIFVLRPGFRTWLIRPAMLKKQLLPFLESIDIHIPADAYVETLSGFEKTVVDVLKSVVAGCKLIVLRDISAYLSEDELKKIHRLIRHYSEQGLSFLYVDFHFEELRQICDKVALMSNGRIIKVLPSDDPSSHNFEFCTKTYNRMVKAQMEYHSAFPPGDDPVFEAAHLRGQTIQDLSFSVGRGECLVLQDVDNYVFRELLAILSGDILPEGGDILVDSEKVYCRGNRNIAVIQEFPSKTMLFHEMSYFDNLCFTLDHRLPELWQKSDLRAGIEGEYAPLLGMDTFEQRVDRLSEMQKYELVYTRIAIQRPRVVFCVQPFRRADLELRMHIWELLKMLLDKKIAVVILAVNLADSLSLADRLIRLTKGRAEKAYLRSEFSEMPVGTPWIEFYQRVNEPKEP